MQNGFYSLRDWAWLWIALGILWPLIERAAEGAWPSASLFALSLLLIVFGAIGAPLIKRLLVAPKNSGSQRNAKTDRGMGLTSDTTSQWPFS